VDHRPFDRGPRLAGHALAAPWRSSGGGGPDGSRLPCSTQTGRRRDKRGLVARPGQGEASPSPQTGEARRLEAFGTGDRRRHASGVFSVTKADRASFVFGQLLGGGTSANRGPGWLITSPSSAGNARRTVTVEQVSWSHTFGVPNMPDAGRGRPAARWRRMEEWRAGHLEWKAGEPASSYPQRGLCHWVLVELSSRLHRPGLYGTRSREKRVCPALGLPLCSG